MVRVCSIVKLSSPVRPACLRLEVCEGHEWYTMLGGSWVVHNAWRVVSGTQRLPLPLSTPVCAADVTLLLMHLAGLGGLNNTFVFPGVSSPHPVHNFWQQQETEVRCFVLPLWARLTCLCDRRRSCHTLVSTPKQTWSAFALCHRRYKPEMMEKLDKTFYRQKTGVRLGVMLGRCCFRARR